MIQIPNTNDKLMETANQIVKAEGHYDIQKISEGKNSRDTEKGSQPKSNEQINIQ